MTHRLLRGQPALRHHARACLPSQARRHGALDDATLGLAFEASPTPAIVTDEHLRIVAANAAYARLVGARATRCVGTLAPVCGLDGESVLDRVRAPNAAPAFGFAAFLQAADGSRRKVWTTWARLGGTQRTEGLHVATFWELQRQDSELQLWRHRAHHDALTGLPNRDHLVAEIDRGIARAARHAHRLALLFIDLDGFKSVNDRFGHASGDRLLAHVGMRLREALRAEDFVARHGGDEFVALLEAPHQAADAARAAQSVLRALSRGLVLPGGSVPAVTASIGIALYPDHAADTQGLLEVADAAMYRVKRAGGNDVAIGGAEAAAQVLPEEAA